MLDTRSQQQTKRKLLLVRNWLNGIFIGLSIIAIIGVLYFDANNLGLRISYGIALLAILIKMVEALFRMLGVFKKV